MIFSLIAISNADIATMVVISDINIVGWNSGVVGVGFWLVIVFGLELQWDLVKMSGWMKRKKLG